MSLLRAARYAAAPASTNILASVIHSPMSLLYQRPAQQHNASTCSPAAGVDVSPADGPDHSRVSEIDLQNDLGPTRIQNALRSLPGRECVAFGEHRGRVQQVVDVHARRRPE